jgi:hypothetical protein
VAEAGRCWILTDESRVALRAAFIRGRKRRTGSPAAKWGENSATRAESAGTMKTFNSIEHNRLKVVGGPGQNTVESIKDRLVGPEFLTSDDPARVFHDKLSRDMKRLLGETDLSDRDGVLGMAYMLAELISQHPSAAARGIVAQRLHEVVADLADKIAGLRDSGMLASRQ